LAHPVQHYRFLMFKNTGSIYKTKHNLTYKMGQKLSSKLLFISSKNTDGFYRFCISQGSVPTQLGCDSKFSYPYYCKFSTECASEENLKIGQYLAKIWMKSLWLTVLSHPALGV